MRKMFGLCMTFPSPTTKTKGNDENIKVPTAKIE
jgi:hypothetical protein